MLRVRRRTNIISGLVVFFIALVLFLHRLDALDDGLYDLFLRSWPALLILTGLTVLLGSRIPFGKIFAFVLTVALVAVVSVFAFSSRADEQRDEYQEVISQPVDIGINLLTLRVQTLSTDVELVRRVDDSNVIQGEFVGSEESVITVEYVESEPDAQGIVVASFSLVEERQSAFPKLEALGRGTLRLEIPANIPLDVDFVGEAGNVSLNMDDLSIERLNVNLGNGDVVVALPEYDPVNTGDDDSLGTLAAHDGDITLIVPESLDARFDLQLGGSGRSPEYDAGMFNYLVGDVLESRTIESADFVVNYTVVSPHGVIRVQSPSGG
ncbi:MAG: hypothetical protein D6737_05110 [Chloroflexi bacterium]|nr:MAG: hypothetical protein D6737_05110 [Chloroflexota bacterium]